MSGDKSFFADSAQRLWSDSSDENGKYINVKCLSNNKRFSHKWYFPVRCTFACCVLDKWIIVLRNANIRLFCLLVMRLHFKHIHRCKFYQVTNWSEWIIFFFQELPRSFLLSSNNKCLNWKHWAVHKMLKLFEIQANFQFQIGWMWARVIFVQ